VEVTAVDVPVGAIFLAGAPIALLVGLVVARRGLTSSAWIAAAAAALAAGTVFGLDLGELAVATVRGVWTGAWILLIVLPALLLFEVLDRSGALARLGDTADQLAPTPGRQVLLLAWILPSFLQGAAGFGAPIAMTAPMLVRRGWAPVAAVATCLVGYQWSVTFGSMGSSYFMAEATARLGPADARSFALRAGVVLAVSALVSGAIVLRRARRRPGDVWRMLALAAVMGTVLVATVAAQPALGSTAAGLAGLLAAWWLLPDRGASRPRGREPGLAALPYIVLTATAAVGFGVPAVREALAGLGELAPVLPGADAAFGFSTPDASMTPGFTPLLHPLPYVLLAASVGVLTYRRAGWWAPGTTSASLRRWASRAWPVTRSLVGLTVLAAVLVEAGMVSALADGLHAALGAGFVILSPLLGTLGTMLTGSTTASNALFASLQAQVATGLGLPPSVLLAGQTAGGNVGNALAPIVIAVGLAAAGATHREGEVLRRNLGAGALLLIAILAMLAVQILLLR
jgi:lactate permease